VKFRALFVLSLTSVVIGGGVAVPPAQAAHPAATNPPHVTNIKTAVALGSTIGIDGSIAQRITAHSSGPTVGWVVTYLPECGADPVSLRFPGDTTFRHTFRQATVGDLCAGDGFELTPFDAAGTSAGTRHAVGTDWPDVVDDDAFGLHGTWTHGCSTASYGGCFVRTGSLGARARLSTDVGSDGPGYSTGIVGQTGPHGGVATVYVDGVRSGQVDFSSRTVEPRKVLFVLGTADFSSVRPAPTHTLALIMTGRGQFGGTTMTLDAVVEDSCCGD
jgi:hypothetical protein